MFPLSTPLPLKNYLHYPKKEMSMGLSIHTFAAERKNPYNEAAKEVLRYEKSNTIHAIGSACRFCIGMCEYKSSAGFHRMKTQKLKRMMSLFLAALICVTTLVGFGTTAYAAEETDEVCLVSFPRDGDANYGGEWGHGSFNFMNGWFAQTSRYTTVRAMGSYDGNICYCIEPGVPQESGDRYTKKGENFWDNYPSSYNHTISPDDIKLFIGRIFQYGYTGTISTSWRSQNEGGDKLAHAVATQLLVWETIVGFAARCR